MPVSYTQFAAKPPMPEAAATPNERFIAELTQCQSQLYCYLMALVHHHADAEDLFQQVSLVLWKKFAAFDPESDFFRWACQTAKFEVCNYLRTRRGNRVVFSEALIDQLAEEQRTDTQLEARQAALSQCLEKLAPDDRTLLDHCYRDNRSIKEASERLGRSTQGTYKVLERIRRQLYVCVQRALALEGER